MDSSINMITARQLCLFDIMPIIYLLCDITVDLVFQSQTIYKHFSIYLDSSDQVMSACWER